MVMMLKKKKLCYLCRLLCMIYENGLLWGHVVVMIWGLIYVPILCIIHA